MKFGLLAGSYHAGPTQNRVNSRRQLRQRIADQQPQLPPGVGFALLNGRKKVSDIAHTLGGSETANMEDLSIRERPDVTCFKCLHRQRPA